MRYPQALLQQMIEKISPEAGAPVTEAGPFMGHLVLKIQLASEVLIIRIPWPTREQILI